MKYRHNRPRLEQAPLHRPLPGRPHVQRGHSALIPPRLGGIAIGRDRAWEHHIHFQNTVLDDNGLGRCWYLASIIRRGLESARFGYAESEDGRHWRKPNLGLVELNGRRDMNLIPPKPKRSNVFIDPTAPPAERYKTFGLSLDGDPGGDGYGVFRLARRLRLP